MHAISSLAPEGGFDLVVSGINRGANVGTASHMSGTARPVLDPVRGWGLSHEVGR